jgi:Ca2+-binding EF-hand superfamily protein
MAEMGLARYSRNNAINKKTLNRDEFILILKNSYIFAKLDKFKQVILYKIFGKIDKNNDGLITFEEYLNWVKLFLAVFRYFGDEFYATEDDYELDKSDPFEAESIPHNHVKFVFSDYTFSKQVRARVYELLVRYDADRNQQFN